MKIAALCGILNLFACLQAGAAAVVPLAVDSVRTHRVKDVLVRVIQYNSDKAELRLETIQPIHHKLLDAVDIKSFTVNGRTYPFATCDEFAVNAVAVEPEAVHIELACFVPKAPAVAADCTLAVRVTKFDKMACTRRER